MRGRKLLSIALTCTLTATLVCSQTFKVKAEDNKVKGNLWIGTSLEDFKKGNLNGAALTKEGDGEIRIDKVNGVYKSKAVYTSETIYTLPFEYMVLSWNSDTPEGTWINVEAQALVTKANGEKEWSSWLSWGNWSTAMDRESFSSSDSLAYVDTDTLTIRGNSGETASALRYRATLNTKDNKKTPVLRLIAGTLRNTLKNQSIPNVYEENMPDLTNMDKTISVPAYSQYLRDPEIANSICSPTSMTMIMNYHGVKILPEESAWGVYDSDYDGFGNWPFNTAFVSSFGFESYVTYNTSLYDLKREIYSGNPVAISVKYRNSENVNKPSLPVVHGAPINYTNGHLIVVCGFTNIDGKEYVVVNDSAASKDEEVKRNYLASELEAAWAKSGRVAYMVHKGDGGKEAPKRLSSNFKEIKNVVSDSTKYIEFELKDGNDIIDLSSKNTLTIMVSKDGGRYNYITPKDSNNLLFDMSSESGLYDYIIIAKGNKIYKASVNWNMK